MKKIQTFKLGVTQEDYRRTYDRLDNLTPTQWVRLTKKVGDKLIVELKTFWIWAELSAWALKNTHPFIILNPQAQTI